MWSKIAVLFLLTAPLTEGKSFGETGRLTDERSSFLCPTEPLEQAPSCCTWVPYTALTDYLPSTTWEKPRGSSNFAVVSRPTDLAHSDTIKSLLSTCTAGQASATSRSATYQSTGSRWGNGQLVRLQFWYKIDAQNSANSRLEVSIITSSRGLRTIWSSPMSRNEWNSAEIFFRENEVYQIRFTAFHVCSASVGLSGITADKMELSHESSCLPTTTPTTTIATSTSTITTTPTTTASTVTSTTVTTTPTITTTTPTTTTQRVYPHPVLTMRVHRYKYSKDCDGWIHANAARCDPRFDITYTWINEEGNTANHKQYYNAGDDLIEVSFPPTIKHAARAQKGSIARVKIVAEDEDNVGSNDHIGTFDFAYIVPSEPESPRLVTSYSNGGEMSVEYTVVF